MTRVPHSIDLKLRLTGLVTAVATFCFFAATAYMLYDSNQQAWVKASAIAETVAKDLELQQAKMHWVKSATDQFPDLQVIAPALMASGTCIGYHNTDGRDVQRLCNGAQHIAADTPHYFAILYRAAFNPTIEISRNITFQNEAIGAVTVTFNPDDLIGQSWLETSRLISVIAVTLSVLCLLVYAALARALRPTRTIRSGLERLAANDLSARLPSFDLAELSAIGEVFNKLAETLEKTLNERDDLTRQLIAVQEAERQNLARELHDEFGQCLAAIGAVAASIGQTAQSTAPDLLPECQSISRIAAQMMEALRSALIRLRPPDIDELGLTLSLESLIAGWNHRSKGRTCFDIELIGSFDALPEPLGIHLYRIAQEAITNAAKHADATRVGLHLQMGNVKNSTGAFSKEIELIVEDNGKASDTTFTANAGMGLLGMRERVRSLGGRLNVKAREPTGLILHAVLPAPR